MAKKGAWVSTAGSGNLPFCGRPLQQKSELNMGTKAWKGAKLENIVHIHAIFT